MSRRPGPRIGFTSPTEYDALGLPGGLTCAWMWPLFERTKVYHVGQSFVPALDGADGRTWTFDAEPLPLRRTPLHDWHLGHAGKAGVVPFGGWEIEIQFEPHTDGGRCAPGCHKEATYSRGPDGKGPTTRAGLKANVSQ